MKVFSAEVKTLPAQVRAVMNIPVWLSPSGVIVVSAETIEQARDLISRHFKDLPVGKQSATRLNKALKEAGMLSLARKVGALLPGNILAYETPAYVGNIVFNLSNEAHASIQHTPEKGLYVESYSFPRPELEVTFA